jgi:diguanylate cyclase (GGDEF)-like protein/PAS domain S-box-containing protein
LTTRQIGLRLGAAFAVLIAILVGIGQLGLRRMHEINETLNDIAGRRSAKLQLAQEALTLSNRNSRLTMEIFLVQNRAHIDTLLAARSENTDKISKLVAEIGSRCESEKEKHLLATVQAARKTYIENYLRALHLLLNEKKRDAAAAIMVNEALPALDTYYGAWNEFTELQKDQVKMAAKQAQVEYIRTRRLGYLLIILAAAVALLIAAFTTRHMTREIGARIDAQKEIGKLNAHLEEKVMQRTRELLDANKDLKLQAAALEAAANAIVITDSQGTILWVNRSFTSMTGYSKKEVLGKNPRLLKSGDQPEAYYANLWSAICSGKVWKGEILNKRKDGTTYAEEMTITPVRQGDGNTTATHFIAIKQDITERKQIEKALKQAENKYRTIFEDAVVGIFQTTPEGCPLSVNRAFAQMHGYDSPEQFLAEVGNVAEQLFIDPGRLGELKQALDENGIVRGAEVEVHCRDHTKKWVRANLRAVHDASGDITLHEGTVEDITDRKAAEKRVQYLAYYDALTGLPNRTLLQDRIAKALASARRQKHKVALLFLDLDRFKDINDSLGHSFGDILLQEVSARLKGWAREQDTVARLGGDEFLIVLTNVKDIPDAAVAAERLMDTMAAGLVIQGHSLSVSCSMGISVFPEHGADSETLIKHADAAMYCAKEHGRNNFQFFTADMNDQVVERLTLENGLRLALEKEELFLVYQPQIDIATGRITGLEALLRWEHPKLGLVPPDKFIRIAENTGLIMPIGEWVLRTACAQARKWQEEGILAVPVAINVSAVQFRQDGFCDLTGRVLCETGLASQYLELELTESLLLSNAHVTFSVLQDLRAMGLKLAIDDFGTGYSSLSYLKHFPVSKLKIDRSFIRDVAVNPDDAAITAAIISMAKSLNLKVIAEGVEDEAQMSFLRAHQCDEIQGYYFSKPLTVDKVAAKLRGDHPETHVRAQASGGQS